MAYVRIPGFLGYMMHCDEGRIKSVPWEHASPGDPRIPAVPVVKERGREYVYLWQDGKCYKLTWHNVRKAVLDELTLIGEAHRQSAQLTKWLRKRAVAVKAPPPGAGEAPCQ